MGKRQLFALIAVSFGLIAVAFLGRPAGAVMRPAPAPVEGSEPEPAAERQVATRSRKAFQPLPAADPNALTANVESPEALERRAQEQNRKNMEALQARFAGEPVDAAWSAQTVAQIRTTLATIPATQVVDAHCNTSLCRVELRHANREDQLQLPDKIATAAPF